MRLVKLIAPDATSSFSVGEKTYAIEANREVDVPEDMAPTLIAEGFKRATNAEIVLMQGPRGEIGIQGKQGEIGPRGPQGPRGPIGPMPRHEWDGTELRFEIEPGVWGAFVDLQGPPGKDGTSAPMAGGILGAGTVVLGGGGSANSWTPSGW